MVHLRVETVGRTQLQHSSSSLSVAAFCFHGAVPSPTFHRYRFLFFSLLHLNTTGWCGVCVCVYVFRFYPFHAFFLSFTCCSAHARSWGGLLSSHLCCSVSPPHLLTLSLCRIGRSIHLRSLLRDTRLSYSATTEFCFHFFASRGTFTILSPVTVTDCVCVVNFNLT